MTRVVVVDVQDLPVHPLLSVFYVPNGLQGHLAILASSARSFPNQESDPFRDFATPSGLLETFLPPRAQSFRLLSQVHRMEYVGRAILFAARPNRPLHATYIYGP